MLPYFQERNIWNSESIQSHLTSIIKSVEANSHDKLCHLLSEIRSQMTIQYDQAKNKIKEGLKVSGNNLLMLLLTYLS